jgi:hypothetical protein
MVSVKHLAAALVLFASSCAAPAAPPSPYPPNTGAVFEGERARALITQCSRTSPGPVEGTWTPTQADVAWLESELPDLVERERQRQWPDDRFASTDFYRQYGGLIIHGRRVVYVNGVRSSEIERDLGVADWRIHAISICDGGPITFGVEYDLQTRMFSNFAFNGAA